MPPARDIFLEEDAGILEVVAGEALDALIHRREVARVGDELQPDAAAAGRALDHHRIADARRFAHRVPDVAEEAEPGATGTLGLQRKLARSVLQAEGAHLVRPRADEHDTGLLAGLGKIGVLRQKAVAWMDGLGAGLARRIEDGVGFEIALGGGRRPDRHRLAGLHDMHGMPVGLGIDRDACDAHAVERADDAAGNGAAVGNEDLAEHVRGPRPRSAPRWASGCRRCRDCSAAGSSR